MNHPHRHAGFHDRPAQWDNAAPLAERKMIRPYNGTAWGLAFAAVMIGLGGLLLYPPAIFIALILFVTGIIIDRKVWTCGQCGNRVEKTSVQCPTCSARLTHRKPAPPRRRGRR